MAHIRTEGDKYLNKMRFDDEENPITIDTLLNSPLAKVDTRAPPEIWFVIGFIRYSLRQRLLLVSKRTQIGGRPWTASLPRNVGKLLSPK